MDEKVEVTVKIDKSLLKAIEALRGDMDKTTDQLINEIIFDGLVGIYCFNPETLV